MYIDIQKIISVLNVNVESANRYMCRWISYEIDIKTQSVERNTNGNTGALTFNQNYLKSLTFPSFLNAWLFPVVKFEPQTVSTGEPAAWSKVAR